MSDSEVRTIAISVRFPPAGPVRSNAMVVRLDANSLDALPPIMTAPTDGG